jgi:hypothetical protein
MTRHFTGVLMAATAAAAVVLPIWPENTAARAQSVYTSPASDFSVAFPGPPEVQAHPPESPDSPGYWTYAGKANGVSLLVRNDQYPASIRVPEPTPRMYELLLRGYAVQTSSRLLSTGAALLGGKPALQGVFAASAGATELRRVLIVGRRVYQVSYVYAEGLGDAAQGAAFLDSFQLSPR